MLSGKDIFGQGKEIVRIIMYKCHIGSYTPRHTEMESKKKKTYLNTRVSTNRHPAIDLK